LDLVAVPDGEDALVPAAVSGYVLRMFWEQVIVSFFVS
jgi:hypothetical protein